MFIELNCILNLKLISHIAIANPMFAAGKKYDDDGECNNSRSVMRWTNSRKAIENTVSTIRELMYIRDSYKECIRFSSQELDVFKLDLCTGWSILLYIFIVLFVYY